ncbi:MAG TPA: 3-phosphoshikimate 1-carboxyvinyltransferase [Chloroflexota bacterium]|nr:3-phosphoshikimate 1-carboxyvinyltransferase [Chloroflexota bacterium]
MHHGEGWTATVPDVIETVEIRPVTRAIDALVSLPGSKSYTNRALLIGALASGATELQHALFSDDTACMLGALRQLGVAAEAWPDRALIRVQGAGGVVPSRSADLFVGNAGTAARFLTAYVALGHGQFGIDGVPRMRQRPIGPLLDALRQLGVDARSVNGNDCPPVVIRSDGLRGGTVEIPGDLSSQYVSALLMVAPCTPDGIDLAIRGELVSKPYVDLTLSVMKAFGATAPDHDYRRIRVPGQQQYRARTYQIEPDASAASYFLAAAAVTGGKVKIEALGRSSAQGDLGLVQILERMGCQVVWGEHDVELRGPERLRGIDVDMGNLSDVAQTLAAIAPFAGEAVRIRGVGHIRRKETDRLAAVTIELRRLGAAVVEHDDGWEIRPSALKPAVVETYDDHRMAMSFAVTGLRVPGLRIANPRCVAKTFPDFFERFARLTAPAD